MGVVPALVGVVVIACVAPVHTIEGLILTAGVAVGFTVTLADVRALSTPPTVCEA